MIEWIEKLPDHMHGALISGALWFGFNYAVLADRAIEKDRAAAVVPACVSAVENQQRSSLAPLSQLGTLMGDPTYGKLMQGLIAGAMPRPLSRAEQVSRCECAAARAEQTLRFDYAVHTATFRIVRAQTVASFSDDALALVMNGACGALPYLQRRG